MKILKSLLAIAFVVMLFVECNKEETPTEIYQNTEYEGIFLKEGRVVFENSETYQAFLKLLFDNQDNDSLLNNIIPGFKSIAEVYEENIDYIDSIHPSLSEMNTLKGVHVVKDINGDNTFERTIDAILLSYVVNENGEFQIDDKVYKMSYDNIVWCDEEYFVSHPNDMTSLLSASSADVEKHEIERYEESAGPRTTTDAECFYYMTPTTPNNTRLRGRMRHTNAVVYSELKLISAHERLESGSWNLFQANELRVEGTGSYHYNVSGLYTTTPYDVYKVEYDEKECNKIIFSYGGATPYSSLGWLSGCSNTHTVQRYTGSMFVTCTTVY